MRLLEQGAGSAWQWLPLVGSDFPLRIHAQRGPLVAWTPHLAGVALKLDRKQEPPAPPARPRSPFARAFAVLFLLLLVGLPGANIWFLVAVQRHLETSPAGPAGPATQGARKDAPASKAEDERERLVAGLHQLVLEEGDASEWKTKRTHLLALYRNLVRRHPQLAVPAGDEQGQLTIAAISVLAERSPGHIEESVRQALEGKGFSDKVIKAACAHVHEQLRAEDKEHR